MIPHNGVSPFELYINGKMSGTGHKAFCEGWKLGAGLALRNRKEAAKHYRKFVKIRAQELKECGYNAYWDGSADWDRR